MSSPLRPGSWRSNRTQFGDWVRDLARNSCAEAKVSAFQPADPTSRCSPLRTDRSSSTIAMTGSDSRSSPICSLFVVLRNSKVEDCARCVLVCGPELASVGLKNGPANGETHAHAARLRGVERGKDLVYCVGGDTKPRVFNCCPHAVWINILGRD